MQLENNGLGDASSTATYDRSKLTSWLHYFLRFWIWIWVDIPQWAFAHKRGDKMALAGVSLVVFVYLLTFFNAAVNLFFVPNLIVMFAMAAGNWGQHVFVNPDCPLESLGLSYDIADADMNQRTFNDGYHAVHHVHSRAHWTELPQRSFAGIDERRRYDTLVFTGIDFFEAWLYATAWPGDGGLHKLARHLVWYGNKTGTPEPGEEGGRGPKWEARVVAELKRRLQPIPLASMQKKQA